MSRSAEVKGTCHNIRISAGIIGIIQYPSIMGTVLMKNKQPLLTALPFMIGYGIDVTFYYWQKVAYSCPNYQHIFSSSLWAVIKTKHTAVARRFECPSRHETYYCVEVPKTHMSTEQLETSHVQYNN